MDLHIFLQISKYYHNSFCWISFLLHLPCHIFCSGGSQTSAHIRIFRGIWKHRYLGPSPESPIHQAWDWTNEFAFLTSCQVTSVGTHFQCNWYLHLMIEKHILISAYVVITWHSDMPYSTVPSFLFLVISIYLFCHWICEARTQCWNLRAQGRLIVLKRQVPFCNFNLKKKKIT